MMQASDKKGGDRFEVVLGCGLAVVLFSGTGALQMDLRQSRTLKET